MSITLFIENDNVLELSSVQDDVDDSYLNEGTASFKLQSTIGVDVDDTTVNLVYVTDSNGIYRGTIDADDVPATGEYIAVFDFTQGNYDAHWEVPCVVIERDD